METIKIQFESEGRTIKRTAILNDTLDDFSKSKKNQGCDLTEYPEDGYWSIVFEGEDKSLYEVEFEMDEDFNKTLIPISAITWNNDVIVDSQKAKII